MICVCVDGFGEVVWSNWDRFYELFLIVSNELLFGVDDDGIVYCWLLEMGDEYWKERFGGGFSVLLIVVGELIYVLSLIGVIYVF